MWYFPVIYGCFLVFGLQIFVSVPVDPLEDEVRDDRDDDKRAGSADHTCGRPKSDKLGTKREEKEGGTDHRQ